MSTFTHILLELHRNLKEMIHGESVAVREGCEEYCIRLYLYHF